MDQLLAHSTLGEIAPTLERSAVDSKEETRRILKLGRTIPRQAASLPVNERRAFIRREVNDLRQMYEPIYRAKTSSSGRELLGSMEGWVTRLVKIVEKDV